MKVTMTITVSIAVPEMGDPISGHWLLTKMARPAADDLQRRLIQETSGLDPLIHILKATGEVTFE